MFRKDARAKRMEFWVQVTAKIQAMGYKLKASDIHIIWGNMLRSAKLTWAQEGRKPRVGDQEIIDFMTEVIREKEKSEVGSRLDLSMEEDEMEGLSSCKEENNFEGEPTVSEDNLKKCEERSTNGEEEILDEPEDIEQVESSDGDASENVSFDDYDYVSFEDIQKNYRVDVSEKPETIRSEVGGLLTCRYSDFFLSR